jgi:Fe-S cluster biogenesis protein NfuA
MEFPMLTRENIEAVLERIRPFMRADQGDIELIDIGEHSAQVSG